VGEAKIQELNKKYRGKNKVTDVLSFPMSEKIEIGSKKSEVKDIGDIFICLPFAKKTAKSENVDIEDKLARLTVHGFLHLLGYDHERSSAEEKNMFSLEDNILRKL
jgi:probable rRNA maturation factor